MLTLIENLAVILAGAAALGLLWAIMTIGVFTTYRLLDIADLTVEGTIVLGACTAGVIIYNGGNPYLATAVAMLTGATAGLLTGLLHTKLKIPALLSGILTMIALYSINIRIIGKANLSLLRADTVFSVWSDMGLSKNISTIIVGVICVVLVGLIFYWFFGTEIGAAIRATGNNVNMARALGINTDNMKILGLIVSNALVGLSGALIAQYLAFADVQMGVGAIVIGLASVIIGEVLFGTRTMNRTIISLVLGAITYRIIIALVLELGMPATDLKLFTAITVIVALSLPNFRSYLNTWKKSAARPDKEAK